MPTARWPWPSGGGSASADDGKGPNNRADCVYLASMVYSQRTSAAPELKSPELVTIAVVDADIGAALLTEAGLPLKRVLSGGKARNVNPVVASNNHASDTLRALAAGLAGPDLVTVAIVLSYAGVKLSSVALAWKGTLNAASHVHIILAIYSYTPCVFVCVSAKLVGPDLVPIGVVLAADGRGRNRQDLRLMRLVWRPQAGQKPVRRRRRPGTSTARRPSR